MRGCLHAWVGGVFMRGWVDTDAVYLRVRKKKKSGGSRIDDVVKGLVD